MTNCGTVREHACPRCGQQTTGAWSEGGLLWAICDDCMREARGETVRIVDSEGVVREGEEKNQ